MIIENFDTAVGLYVLRFEHLETKIHSHPALEMLFAEHGSFTITMEQGEYVNLKFTVIEYNRKHQITELIRLIRLIRVLLRYGFIEYDFLN